MPFSNFTNLDFDQIKISIKDYLRANSKFSDFDFDGSNFSVLIDTLAYNTYITAFNSNMIVNESFLDSATLRENVVSLASNIGYTPRSRTAANAQISFDVEISDTVSAVTLQPGLVCTGDVNNETYTFAITEKIEANVVDKIAKFENGITRLRLKRSSKVMLAANDKFEGFHYSGVPTSVTDRVELVADCNYSGRLDNIFESLRNQFKE